MRVAAYCRVSTENDSQQNSLASQRNYFEEYINNTSGWENAGIFYDEGVSGTSVGKRIGFRRMLNEVNQGKIDLIITKEISRFARNTVDTLYYTRKLRELGVGVYFINDSINTLEPDGELRLAIMSSIAQEESRKTSERVKWGQKRRMEQGVVFGKSLLGYDVRSGSIFIEPLGAEIVRTIFYKYVYEGKSANLIAKELSAENVYVPHPIKWNSLNILRILKNEKYAGDLCQKKTYTPDYLTHVKKYNNGEEEKILIRNHHEPIIDRLTWEAAQRVSEKRRSCRESIASHYSCRYPYSGKIICGECGRAFISRTKVRSDGSVYKAWRCSEATRHGTKKSDSHGSSTGCASFSINEKVIDSAILHALEIYGINPDDMANEAVAVLCSAQKSACNSDESLTHLLKKTEQKRKTLLEHFLEGIISPEDYSSQNQLYQRQIDALRSQLSAEKPAPSEDTLQKHILSILESEECVREICGEAIDRITVYTGNAIEISLKYMSPVRLHYEACGRGRKYNVSITQQNDLSF